MTHRNADLIVPVRDRRRRRRILTLKNLGWAFGVLMLIFACISFRSEMRGRSIAGGPEYGRLYGKTVPQSATIERKPVETVTEGSIQDQVSADPFLVQPAGREQLLRVDPLTPQPVPQQPVVASLQQQGGHVAIVGGTEGVAVVQTKRADLPHLGGGFGRQ